MVDKPKRCWTNPQYPGYRQLFWLVSAGAPIVTYLLIFVSGVSLFRKFDAFLYGHEVFMFLFDMFGFMFLVYLLAGWFNVFVFAANWRIAEQVCLKNGEMCVKYLVFRTRRFELTDIQGIELGHLYRWHLFNELYPLGRFWMIRFRDGSVVAFNKTAEGSDDLAATLSEKTGVPAVVKAEKRKSDPA